MPLRQLPAAVRPASLTDNLLLTVRSAIVRGELEPGEVLVEASLAESLGVSRTPVREMLRRLVEVDLVRMDVGRRYTVTPIEPEQLEQIVVVLAELTGLAARLAGDYLTQQDREWIENTTDVAFTFTPVAPVPAWLPTGAGFADLLLARCGNPTLVQTVDRYRPHFARMVAITEGEHHVPPGRVEQILDALRQPDREALGVVVRDAILHDGMKLVTAAATLVTSIDGSRGTPGRAAP